MRVFCTGLVLLAMVGFVSPRATNPHCHCVISDDGGCCCPSKGMADPGSVPTSTKPLIAGACCSSSLPPDRTTEQNAPLSEPADSSDQNSPGESPLPEPDSTCCHTCGVICAAKITVLSRGGPAYLTPTPAGALIAPSEAAPTSLALNGIFRPPRTL